jgi:hypothetical protein
MDPMSPKEFAFWRKVAIDNSCWKWLGGLNDMGYGRFHYKGKYRAAGKESWEFTNGPIPEGAAIRHSCHEPQCVRPSHLVVDIRLTAANVLDIKKALKSPYHSCTRLAEQWSVSANTIYDIRKGRTWKNV